MKAWIFDRIIRPLFRAHFNVHYSHEPNIVYNVINVHFMSTLPTQLDPALVQERIATEMARDLLNNRLVKVEATPQGSVTYYKAQLLVLRK